MTTMHSFRLCLNVLKKRTRKLSLTFRVLVDIIHLRRG